MIIKWIINLLKVLNSNQNPAELAAGIAFAFLLALVPADNLLWYVLLIITFFLRVHMGTQLIFLAIFKLIAPVFDAVLHPLGYAILTIPSLQGFFTKLYNTPLVPFTKFNNTIVMGGLVAGVVLWVPLFILFLVLVKMYRDKLMAAIQNSKIVKGFMNLPLISMLVKGAGKASGLVK
jgi:uncharacterized protein (TIGR03546 family)